jgi:hypothetical protein
MVLKIVVNPSKLVSFVVGNLAKAYGAFLNSIIDIFGTFEYLCELKSYNDVMEMMCFR